jgi:hypothetical protein
MSMLLCNITGAYLVVDNGACMSPCEREMRASVDLRSASASDVCFDLTHSAWCIV